MELLDNGTRYCSYPVCGRQLQTRFDGRQGSSSILPRLLKNIEGRSRQCYKDPGNFVQRIPEVPFGTASVLLSMLGATGILTIKKKRL